MIWKSCCYQAMKMKTQQKPHINSTNSSASFQTPSVFCPSLNYRFSFRMSPDKIDDLCFGFALFSFVNSLAFASNILLPVDMNSLSKYFGWVKQRLDGDEWLHALIPVNPLIDYNTWPFSGFTSAKNIRKFHSSPLNLLFLDPL